MSDITHTKNIRRAVTFKYASGLAVVKYADFCITGSDMDCIDKVAQLMAAHDVTFNLDKQVDVPVAKFSANHVRAGVWGFTNDNPFMVSFSTTVSGNHASDDRAEWSEPECDDDETETVRNPLSSLKLRS